MCGWNLNFVPERYHVRSTGCLENNLLHSIGDLLPELVRFLVTGEEGITFSRLNHLVFEVTYVYSDFDFFVYFLYIFCIFFVFSDMYTESEWEIRLRVFP